MLKKIFFKKVSSILGLFIVCGFSLTLGAILLRVAFSAVFQEPISLPSDDPHDLGTLADKIGNPGDAAGMNTVFGKIAGVGGGGGGGGGEQYPYRPPNNGKIVFFVGPFLGNLGGVSGAYALCQTEAERYGLSGTYKAWIASSIADDPESIFTRYTEPLYIFNPNSVTKWTKIADDWNDLTDGEIDYPILMSLIGVKIDFSGSPDVWTSVDTDGKYLSGGSNNCLNWTTSNFGNDANMIGGGLLYTFGRWTKCTSGCTTSRDCSTPHNLYCFEQ